ncbi:MAG: hypothetical protein M1830_003748, partial [Pleopsidium flavum]
TLDEELDAALGGGVPTGYITEITGESGAGKTQFLLTLLLTAQLPPPHGLSRNTLYISTESPLSTPRLSQLLTTHPHLSTLSPSSRPSLDRVLSIQTPDLESQDHILTYQLPVAIARHNIGLVVLDSVAANYRAEFSNAQAGTGTARSGLAMAKRSAELVRLGQLLRTLARTHDLAVVVANQVADRFTQVKAPSRPSSHHMPSSPAEIMPPPPPSSSTAPLSSSQPSLAADHNRTSTPSISAAAAAAAATPLTLDHQQRFFTGWGDLPLSTPHTNTLTTINNNNNNHTNLKTPSLGLTWTNQLACRIALLKEPVYTDTSTATNTTINKQNWPTNESSGEKTLIRWRRWMKVVFAPWVAGAEGQRGVEFEITGTGLRSLHPAMEDHGVEGAQPFHRLTR